MIKHITYWIGAIRPHTLPLAFSASALGIICAAYHDCFSSAIAFFTILTALLLQILSNLSNDYGDYKHGADNINRKGPIRSLQSGKINPRQMKKAVITTMLLSFISGSILLYLSIEIIGIVAAIVFLFLGLTAIWAAYAYTASSKPYGYNGLGDLSVFIFFGLFAVKASFFLSSGNFSPFVLPAAVGMGCLSVAVLNLNNMRDVDNDAASGKKTMVVMMGIKAAKIYHAVLLIAAVLCFLGFALWLWSFSWKLVFVIPLLLLVSHIYSCFRQQNTEKYYSQLKSLSLASLIIVLSFGVSLFIDF